jgi:DNA-binding PadR family transcriptional regulator
MRKKTHYAILGILTFGPQSGYDIKKFIGGSIGHFWQESYGQLYPTLKILVQDQLAEMQVTKNDGKPDKKVYTITDLGRAELKKWLNEPVIDLPVLRNELLLKLFFGSETDDQVMQSHLSEIRKVLVSKKETLELIKKQMEIDLSGLPGSKYWLITVLNGIYSYEANIKWVDHSIEILKEG